MNNLYNRIASHRIASHRTSTFYGRLLSLTFVATALFGLSACGGGGSSDTNNSSNSSTNTKKTFNLSVIIDSPIETNGLMLKNTATGADNTPFAVAKTTASTLNLQGKITEGSDYDIKVVQQPEGFAQHCHVEQGTGTFVNTDIAIQLKCVEGVAKVSTYAGIKGEHGATNGSRQDAKFKIPLHMVFDSKGNLFIVDYVGHQIRKITPEGEVSLFAGNKDGKEGSSDGTGNAASFKEPWSIAVDKADNLYVGSLNRCIRKITPQAVVTTLAGKCGTQGDVPEKTNFKSDTTTGTAARLGNIKGMVYDGGDDALYVFDSDNKLIRKISLNEGTAATAKVQNIITTSNSEVSMGLSADKKRLYYIPGSDYKLYELDLTSTAQVKTAKPLTTTTKSYGFKDGGFAVAQFKPSNNQLIASKSGQFLYLPEYGNDRIRRIDLINKTVDTLAGSSESNVTDGIGTKAAFRSPLGIAQDAQGNLFVSSIGNVIRKLELVKKP